MYIRRAAMIFQGGGMVEGQDYNQIIDIAHHFGFTGTYVNGFLTNENEFVGGEVALKIAKEAGQVPADHSKLHPEDLFGSEGYEIN